jgi:hypothetical protein
VQFETTLCSGHGPHASDSTSRLCHYLPVVREQINLVISTILVWDACLALLTLGVACAGSWHFWELAYVEKKAAKHKRRRKHRKNSIPWDKIKVRASVLLQTATGGYVRGTQVRALPPQEHTGCSELECRQQVSGCSQEDRGSSHPHINCTPSEHCCMQVEDMGPISYCGAAAPATAASKGASTCDVKKKV